MTAPSTHTSDTPPRTRIAVVTSDGARDLDERTIATLPDSYALMHRAAWAAAEWLHAGAARSAAVYVGPGNNGGDGWLIAGMLREAGWQVTVRSAGEPKTADAVRARADAESAGPFAPPTGTEALILDALLGTGAVGTPRGVIADALAEIRAALWDGVSLVAIDIPSGLDATTGADGGAIAAARTLTFGSVKRGQLLRRDLVGELYVIDIGLVDADAETPRLVDATDVQEWIPSLPPDAWKGTRGRLAIVGGDTGMAGAAILAARGAHASGIGMVRADVAADSALPLQVAVPFATVNVWRPNDWSGIDTRWPDAMVIGPGLDGTASHVRERVLSLLRAFRGPVVLDAGALTAFGASFPPRLDAEDLHGAEDRPDGLLLALRHALGGRPALLTPHVGEFRRLFPQWIPGSLDATHDRFEAPSALARLLDATVLLKGVPTIIAAPDGTRSVCAAGNPALAMGGTGDLLAGIAGALLAQGLPALHAGAAAAWVHGAAAERAVARHGGWRGVTMELLLHEVTNVWPGLAASTSRPMHTLSVLPAVPTR